MDFIIAGGVCAVLHGAPLSTFDLDLVHSREPDNVRRLLTALGELDAQYRDPAGRKIKPTEEDLSSPEHHLLITRGGPLDLLGEIGQGRDYQDLLSDTVAIEVSEELRVRALSLRALIREKEQMARPKDEAVLDVLRKTLEEKNE
ncbi:MAG: hypothetical protein KGZ25_05490 [Planctomycetes bacterium]|nr:hypothetical protein [Planctomycetota bacterium]